MIRSCICLGLFSVKEKDIFSAGTILRMDQIKRMNSDFESNKQVSVKFLLNPSLLCMQVCLLVLNRVLGFLT